MSHKTDKKEFSQKSFIVFTKLIETLKFTMRGQKTLGINIFSLGISKRLIISEAKKFLKEELKKIK